jgi:hypothetical protein
VCARLLTRVLLGGWWQMNQIVAEYKDSALSDRHVQPERGQVCFLSGSQGWAFTLAQFARTYTDKFGITLDKMTERLWGDNYFLVDSRKWTREGPESARAFNLFVLDPIAKVFQACANKDREKLTKMSGPGSHAPSCARHS